jgi:ABC-2 type transport system permease protein
MSMTATEAAHTSAPSTPLLLRMLGHQAGAQARMFLRTPAVSVVSFAMPLILYLFFAVPNIGRPYLPGVDLGTFMLASFAAYAVSSVMVFNYGVTIAMDRGQRVDVLMRASPLPGSVYLVARAVTALALGLAGLAVLLAVAVLTGARLSPRVWLDLAVRLLLGSLPFVGLGFALAYLCSPTAAPAVANMLFLVLAFGSGMLVRVDQMPDVLRASVRTCRRTIARSSPGARWVQRARTCPRPPPGSSRTPQSCSRSRLGPTAGSRPTSPEESPLLGSRFTGRHRRLQES